MTSLPSWARVGAKVVCLTDYPAAGRPSWEIRPVKGGIYTVREVIFDDDEPCILLAEITNDAFLS